MSQRESLNSSSLDGENTRECMMFKGGCDVRMPGKKLERIRDGFVEAYLNWVLKA